jgi:hypothetical protein
VAPTPAILTDVFRGVPQYADLNAGDGLAS